MHEQSVTEENPAGGWWNIYGPGTLGAGLGNHGRPGIVPLPRSPRQYPTSGQAAQGAAARSELVPGPDQGDTLGSLIKALLDAHRLTQGPGGWSMDQLDMLRRMFTGDPRHREDAMPVTPHQPIGPYNQPAPMPELFPNTAPRIRGADPRAWQQGTTFYGAAL